MFKYTFFNSNPPVVSARVKKILSNPKHSKIFGEAIRIFRNGGSGIFKLENNA